MDLASLGIEVNITLLIAIVGSIEFIKKMDYQNKLKPVYWLFSLVFSLIAGALITDYKVMADSSIFVIVMKVFLNFFIYFGISTLFYQYILKLVQKFMDKLDQVIENGRK